MDKLIGLPLAHVRGVIKIVYPQKLTPSKTSCYTVYYILGHLCCMQY